MELQVRISISQHNQGPEMKKLILPALVIAAVGGYFYYTNLEVTAPRAVTAEDAMVEEVQAAMAEVEAAGPSVSPADKDVMAAADEDVFADVPEAMEHALDETSETAVGDTETVPESDAEIDHAHE